MRKFSLLLVLFSLSALGGCNTVRGIGQDIGHAGAAIEKAAK